MVGSHTCHNLYHRDTSIPCTTHTSSHSNKTTFEVRIDGQ